MSDTVGHESPAEPPARARRRAAKPVDGQESPALPIPQVSEPVTESREVTEAAIRVRAFEIFLARRGSDGSDVEDWFAAQKELRALQH